MTLLAVMRHAPTAWNQARRLQGRADMPITDAAREALGRRSIPLPYSRWTALSSPLARCLQTAAALDLRVTLEPRLAEMDWGGYQGHTIEALRKSGGAAFRANERRGLDFTPPWGESPRDVQARLAPLLSEIAERGVPILAVSHRGVIRALYAQAVGWDMRDDSPHRLDLYGALQLFRLSADGKPTVDALNIPFAER